MTLDLLYTIIVCAILWVSSVVIILLYIRLGWSRRISAMEDTLKEYDWRIAATEAKFIRTQEDLKEIKRNLYDRTTSKRTN